MFTGTHQQAPALLFCISTCVESSRRQLLSRASRDGSVPSERLYKPRNFPSSALPLCYFLHTWEQHTAAMPQWCLKHSQWHADASATQRCQEDPHGMRTWFGVSYLHSCVLPWPETWTHCFCCLLIPSLLVYLYDRFFRCRKTCLTLISLSGWGWWVAGPRPISPFLALVIK